MKTVMIFIVFTLAALTVLAAPVVNDGDITDVIVYHGRALVTRTVPLEKATGDVELLVENLPERILPESLYAQAADGIQVLSVRYRVKEIEKDTRAEVRAVDEKIEQIQTEIYQATRDREFSQCMWDQFSRMWNLSFEGADISLDRGAFSSETMKDFTGYLAEKNAYFHTESVRLELLKKDLEKQLAQLQEERAKLASEHKRSIRQALVYLHVPKAAASNAVHLSYLVDGADWSPQYNLKAAPEKKSVHVEYNAVVHQASGEDWTNAELALSTAVPALVATPPTLEPLQITLTDAAYRARGISSTAPASELALGIPGQQADMARQVQQFTYTDQTERFAKFAQDRRANIAKGIKANEELNFYASNTQMIEFEADKRLLQQLKEKAVAIQRAEGVSVMYQLPGRLTLPSKSDQQLVTIASVQCPAAFTFVAAPLLTDYVYLQGDMTNTSDTILLPGPADTFRNGEFVGKADMQLVTIGQTFTSGFGVDSQIQVAREFKDKKIETLWGNRMDEHQYRIAINNYKNTAVPLRLMDRLPWTENEALSIELTSNSHPLCDDTEYVRTQKDKGILRWDLNLKPETNGKDATVVNYSFLMKYDNDMTIRNVR